MKKPPTMQTEPIIISEVVKLALRIVGFLVTLGYLSAADAEQVNLLVAAIAPTAVEAVNWLITWYKQRGGVFSPATFEEATKQLPI
jgi:hypothetical protein